ncbi:hypothetical protein LSH36_807g00121 [Paralvinella palmiformis]|uniref:BHLH domain-containing protein n=1 Tax=Paralvinella palmiformis TaxID=53620 RepID=A0AAD9MS83_9ANNE|nr:hypothetical protein LSH36_807g00121 [Paralvinella palmiformis]
MIPFSIGTIRKKQHMMHRSQSKRRRYLNRKRHRVCLRPNKQKEFEQLRILVPALSEQQDVNKVTVIEETIRYIDHLHNQLLQNMHKKAGSNITIQDMITAAHQLFLQKQQNTESCAPSNDIDSSMSSADVKTIDNG